MKVKKILFYVPLALSLALVINFWWQGNSSQLRVDEAGMLIALGRLSGLLAVYFVLLQLVLIGRVRWLEPAFGLDKLSYVHHLNGVFLLVFLIGHPLSLSLGYGLSRNTFFLNQLWDFITNWGGDVFFAFVALLLFLLVIALSYWIYKNRKSIKYEWWYGTHLLVYAAIALASMHQVTVGTDLLSSAHFSAYWYLLYTFAFGNLILFRFLKPAWQFQTHGFYIDRLEKETQDVTSVYITGKNMDKFRVLPGQFMIFRFLADGFRWQAHPFSLSGRPDEDHIRISVKNVGDFTSQIPQLKPGTKVIIDGPHGIFTEKSSRKDKVLFIAGGIGITPIRSLLEALVKNGKDAVMLYGNRTQDDIAFKQELDDLSRAYRFPVHHILSQDPSFSGEKGRIDKDKIRKLVPDFKEREVFLCGPVPMMKAIVADLESLGVKSPDIHFEKFSL